jgi:3-oxoacyl-[acyl-carrier-protein] synthase-3
MFQSFISGTGAYLPERILTNFDLEKMVDTSDEWITQRTGIRQRRIAAAGESTSDLALKAARIALCESAIGAGDLDAIILCTVTPDTYCPAGAVYVQRGLEAPRAAAFDINAACTGFVYGLTVANGLIASGTYRNILVVGAETLSRVVDFTDRNTCILFGDGAGAAVLSRAPEAAAASGARGPSRLIDCYLRSDGSGWELICMPGGGSRRPASPETISERLHFLRMQGREVFKFATRSMIELLEVAFERNGISVDDLNLVIPHQVNYRIIEAVLRKISIPEERIYLNLDRYGNTSAASVPIALYEAVQTGRLRRGDLVLLVAFGAGLTWGYNLLCW